MNEFYFTGQIQWAKVYHEWEWPEARILVQIPSVQVGDQRIDSNKVFVRIRLQKDYDESVGKKVMNRRSEALSRLLVKDKHVFIRGAMITQVKNSYQDDHGDYQSREEPGVRVNPGGVSVRDEPFPALNYGNLQGQVLKSADNKFVLQNKYQFPTRSGEMKRGTRDVPVLIDGQDTATEGTQVFCVVSLCGKTPDDEDRVYAVTNTPIKLW